jgi:hypothetical protein
MTLRGFAGAALDEPLPEPATAPRPSHLDEPVPGDKRLRAGLAAMRPRPLRTVGDLLEHVPFRYEDFRDTMRIADLQPGEQATIVCTVDSIRVRPTRRRNLVIVEARVHDDSGPGLVVWFNQRYLVKQLTPGTVISVRGERRGSIGAEISAKSHEVLGEGAEALHTHGLVPVYHGSEAVTSRRLRTLVDGLLGHAGDAPDVLPAELRQRRKLPLRRDASLAAHRPDDPGRTRAAKGRLAFDELFLLQVGLVRHRRQLEGMASARSVVATTVGGPPEFVTPEAGVLVNPTDELALAAALDEASRLPRPNHAARSAAELHDIATQATRVEELLVRAAKAPSAPSPPDWAG